MWIVAAVASYFLLAVVAHIDRYLLAGSRVSPKAYVFYVGVLGGGIVALLAMLGLVTVPTITIAFFGLLAGMTHAVTLLLLLIGLRDFEASRIIPAYGGTVPIFTLLLTVMFTSEKQILLPINLLAFSFLLAGSVIITISKDRFVTERNLLFAMSAALFGAVSFFLSKFVYDAVPFFSALSWLLLGMFFTSLVFLFSKNVRHQIASLFFQHRSRKVKLSKRLPVWIFVGTLIAGGSAAFLQNIAIALVPFGFLPFVNAMSGIEYLFIFVFAIILSRRFPALLQDEISRNILVQKIIAISFIGVGLVLLAL